MVNIDPQYVKKPHAFGMLILINPYSFNNIINTNLIKQWLPSPQDMRNRNI
jgi:hypothetical protein